MIRDEAAQDEFFNPKDEADPVEADEISLAQHAFWGTPSVDIDWRRAAAPVCCCTGNGSNTSTGFSDGTIGALCMLPDGAAATRCRKCRRGRTARRAKSGIASSTRSVPSRPRPGGRIVRTIGIVRAKAKIGPQNLAYNIRRLVTLDRFAAT